MNFGYKFYLIICLGFLNFLVLGSFFYSYIDHRLKTPFYQSSRENIKFEVLEGDTLFKISKRLYEENLISSGFLFDYYVKRSGKENSLKAGEYLFSKSDSIEKVANKIIFGDVFAEKVKLVVPEGFDISDISKRLAEMGVTGKKDILKYRAGDFKKDHAFLSDIDDNATLEGFLFPDTYEYDKKKISTEAVIKSMLDNFEKKFNGKLNADAKKDGKNIFDIVTMASIVEKEVRTKEDMKVVSGILWKRINFGMPLQVDATIVYFLGGKNITREDLNADSPYNTYLHKGLPKGPISNPGMQAIEAAIYPTDSEYWFYISKPDGETVFSKDLKEHTRAINKYLR